MKIRLQIDYVCTTCKCNGKWVDQERGSGEEVDTQYDLELFLPEEWFLIFNEPDVENVAVFCANCKEEGMKKYMALAKVACGSGTFLEESWYYCDEKRIVLYWSTE